MLVEISFICVKNIIKYFPVKISILKCRNFLQITFFYRKKRFVKIAIHKFNVFYVVKIMEIINYNAQKSFSIEYRKIQFFSTKYGIKTEANCS